MNYKFKTEPYQHQYEIWEKSWRAKYYALFLEMGTGKSKIAIDTMGALYQAGEIDTALLIAPKVYLTTGSAKKFPRICLTTSNVASCVGSLTSLRNLPTKLRT